jgi:ankyrin repeat protein
MIVAHRREALTRLLLKARAEVDASDENGDTALMKAYRPQVARALLEAGAADTYRVLEVWMALHPRRKAG